MSGEQLSALAGIAISLVMEYVPGVSEWYEALNKRQKQGVMGLALIAIALSALGLACLKVGNLAIACNQAGAWALATNLIAALVANQATYLIARKS